MTSENILPEPITQQMCLMYIWNFPQS